MPVLKTNQTIDFWERAWFSWRKLAAKGADSPANRNTFAESMNKMRRAIQDKDQTTYNEILLDILKPERRKMRN